MAALGIDIGTTTVEAAVVDGSRIAWRGRRATDAAVPSAAAGASEQDVAAILAALDAVLADMDAAVAQRIDVVQVCTQMHGVVLWATEPAAGPSGAGCRFGTLVTWQDQRCSEAFLREHALPPTGYGCSTLAWKARFEPGSLAGWQRCGTIGDLVVDLLIGRMAWPGSCAATAEAPPASVDASAVEPPRDGEACDSS